MYVKSFLAFIRLPSHARLCNGRIATKAGLYITQIRQGQSTLRDATRMGFIPLPIPNWMPFPPLLASYA